MTEKSNTENQEEKARDSRKTEPQENLLTRLNQQYSSMSKGQKRLADYISEHYDQAVFMTAAKLGAQVNVSESTTVRFAMQLGYVGFPEFHRALEELVKIGRAHV